MTKYVDFVLGDGATRPAQKYRGDAGWDLFVSRDDIIMPGETKDIHTDIRIQMPFRVWGRITGRSSTMRKHNLLVNEGIIDNGYTGELFIIIRNMGDKPFKVEKGMRLAQIIFHVIEDIRWSEVDDIENKQDSRGNNGFGSTGIKDME